jgi:hypothetical protein
VLIVLPGENYANIQTIKSRAAIPSELYYADLLISMEVAFGCKEPYEAAFLCTALRISR